MVAAAARRADALPVSAPIQRQAQAPRAAAGHAESPHARPVKSGVASSKPRTVDASTVMLLLAIAAAGYGYSTRNSDIFVPYEGAGYYLGIAGGTGMLLQLLYSAVKRLRPFRRMAASRILFNMHMLLGLAAPIVILFHCNFSWGAKNSNVALATMLLVVASGLIGRLVYRKIHHGLNGARSDAHQMLEHARTLLAVIEHDTGGTSGSIATRLAAFTSGPAFHTRGLVRQFASMLIIPFKIRLVRLKFASMIRRAVAENADKHGWSSRDRKQHRRLANTHVKDFLDSYSRASQLAFWERVFSLWHLFHVPLFYLLLLSGIAHVVAVHWY